MCAQPHSFLFDWCTVFIVLCSGPIICFVMFLVNDLYGFINWKQMEKRQTGN